MNLRPTWCCESIYTLDIERLKEHKVKYILTDLDNTLAPCNVAKPPKEVFEVVNKISELNIKVIVVSNNTEKRVKLFCTDLNVDIIGNAMKPFTKSIRKYLKKNNINIDDCVIIGDQILTDIKCAKRLNCRCILTNPLSKKDSIFTFVNRKLDQYYRKKYNLENSCSKIDRSDVE